MNGYVSARSTSAPEDGYRRRFAEVMSGHGGTDTDSKLNDYYRSQCLKDDAMAEAIADYLTAHPHRQPLVVHLCGRFHSDCGQGTVQRLLQRRPLTRLRVLSMEVRPDESADAEAGNGNGNGPSEGSPGGLPQCHSLMQLPANSPSSDAEPPSPDADRPGTTAVLLPGKPPRGGIGTVAAAGRSRLIS